MLSTVAVPIHIETLGEEDIPGSARVHRLAFPASAISQLGVAAAERYHASLLARDDVVAFAAFDRSRVVGFCFAGTASAPEGDFLRDNLGFIAGEILRRPLLLTRPFIRERILAGLRFLRPRRSSPSTAIAQPAGARRSLTILYVAVAPSHQRRGIAKAMLDRAEQHARAGDFESLDLSVYLDNARAIGFYEHAGWRRLIQDDGWQGFMFKPLN